MSSSNTIERDRIGGVQADPNAPLLSVENLTVEFRTPDGVVNAVNGISYDLEAGETLAILGESGSGKSVSAQAIMGIVDSPPGFITEGAVRFRGVNLFEVPEKERRKVRGARIAMIFQDALTALNPTFTVGWQIAEMYRQHWGTSRQEAKAKAVELMQRVKIPSAAERVDSYPHEFSGGMRQRVMIAMALALDPDVLIADEPTTALDVTVQAQIMGLLADLQRDTGMGLIVITHDLGVVAEVADRVNVMYAGRIVETGPINEIYHNPSHPYTLGLMHSIPRADLKGMKLEPIQGSPPDLRFIPSGCAFRTRCPFARDRCAESIPPLDTSVPGEGRASACFYFQEVLARD
jgi:oligopeptide transport system ATP-binding protein